MEIKKNKSIIINAFLIIITLVLGIILGLWQVKPPRVNEHSSDYPAYLQMMDNIERFAVRPHPSGSEEIERVRSMILAEIENMGLTAKVEDASYTANEYAQILANMYSGGSVDLFWEWHKEWAWDQFGISAADEMFSHMLEMAGVGILKNIIVNIDAPDTDRGILILSHYDSVSEGPGAADAMLPICAILEAMRKHAQNGELQNDIYFLITDAEEHGLLGARKFVENNPEMKDKIDLVINLEARGNRGALILFETSAKAYNLVKTVVRSGAKPIGMSWAAAIYAQMPNNTDLTIFLEDGYNGINFAAIEGVENYHMPTDSYENLNRDTAWQYLLTTVSLIDYAAGNTLEDLLKPSQDAVYFVFLPGVLMLMTTLVSHIFCTLACILALAFLIIQIKKKRLKPSFITIFMGLFILLSVVISIFFASGSYLFYIPLFCMTLTAFFKERKIPYLVAKMLSGFIVLLLWVPVLHMLWVSMVQPMISY